MLARYQGVTLFPDHRTSLWRGTCGVDLAKAGRELSATAATSELLERNEEKERTIGARFLEDIVQLPHSGKIMIFTI